MAWKNINKGERFPADAFRAGEWGPDGKLYVCRSEGEIGKLNTSTGTWDGTSYNMRFVGAPGKVFGSGQVLTIPSNMEASWAPFRKGQPLPEGAWHGGHTSADGALYVGRSNGEIGKINCHNSKTDGLMHNGWFHAQKCQTSGEILCIKRKRIRLQAALIPLLSIEGGGKGKTRSTKEVVHGCSMTNYSSSTGIDIVAQAEGALNILGTGVSGSLDTSIKTAFRSALQKRNLMVRTTQEIELDVSKQQYVYQAKVTNLDDNTEWMSDSLIFTSKKLSQTSWMLQ